MTYTQLIKEVQELSIEDKENLKELIDKYLIEEKRETIYGNYKESLQELNEGKAKFSDNPEDLDKMLEN
jgi:phosphopantothenate synthetase